MATIAVSSAWKTINAYNAIKKAINCAVWKQEWNKVKPIITNSINDDTRLVDTEEHDNLGNTPLSLALEETILNLLNFFLIRQPILTLLLGVFTLQSQYSSLNLLKG
jgi:hypothetical protein